MKAKKIFLALLVMFSLIIPFTLSSFALGDLHLAADDIEWGVKEGEKYTWVVKESNESLGFLPVNSKYELAINSIETWPSVGGEQQTELFVNLTAYNSVTEIATRILNNESFVYFDAGTNTTSFYTPFTDHGFCMPTNYRDDFVEGLFDYFSSVYGFDSYDSFTSGIFNILGYYSSTDLLYNWFFNSKLIVDHFFIRHGSDFNEIEYHLELQVFNEPIISYGNYFLIFIGFAILSLIYIYVKKVEKKF